jgi:hypothetical protein
MTYEKLYNKVLEIDVQEIKEKFIVVCECFKKKCGCAIHKLY